MTEQAWISRSNGKPFGALGLSMSRRLRALRAHLAAWVGTCADYYQAAALYDDLSRLSDAELGRRGQSRATLAWDLSQSCEQQPSQGRHGESRAASLRQNEASLDRTDLSRADSSPG